MIQNLTEHQPHLVVEIPGEVHVIPVSAIRDCKHGRYLGDCALMAQLLAVALLDCIGCKDKK